MPPIWEELIAKPVMNSIALFRGLPELVQSDRCEDRKAQVTSR